MNKYEIRVIPKEDVEGKTYWTAFYPAIEGCVGGGETAEEAIREAEENLEFFLEYKKKKKREIPKSYVDSQFSGKIALRIPKSTHKLVAIRANEEKVSINTFLVSAIMCYLGQKEYEYQLDKKIEQLRDIANDSLKLQGINFQFNKAYAYSWANSIKNVSLGGSYD